MAHDLGNSMLLAGYAVGRPVLGVPSNPHGRGVAPGLIGLIARTAPEKAVICKGASKNCRRATLLAGRSVFNRRIERLGKVSFLVEPAIRTAFRVPRT